MKNLTRILIHSVSSLALLMVLANVNSACFFWQHQEKVPESAQQYKRI